MNKSPQYNQQNKPKMYLPKHGKWHQHLKYIVGSIPERILSNNICK